jgi:hypothetical protein
VLSSPALCPLRIKKGVARRAGDAGRNVRSAQALLGFRDRAVAGRYQALDQLFVRFGSNPPVQAAKLKAARSSRAKSNDFGCFGQQNISGCLPKQRFWLLGQAIHHRAACLAQQQAAPFCLPELFPWPKTAYFGVKRCRKKKLALLAQGRSTLPRNGFASEMEMNPFPFPSQIHFHFPVYACQEMDFEMEMEMVRDPFPGRAWFPLHLRFCKPEVQDPSGNGFERTL